MTDGDFYGSEQSAVIEAAGEVRIEFVDNAGNTQVLKPSIKVQAGEVIDCSRMSTKALRAFFAVHTLRRPGYSAPYKP